MFFATIGITAAGKSGFLAAGTFISSECVQGSYTGNYNGNPTNPVYGNWDYQVTRADGIGGTYSQYEGSNTGGCYHPAGLQYNVYSSYIYLPGPYGDVGVGTATSGDYADGIGGTYYYSNNSYNVPCGSSYANYSSIDGATGWPMTTYWILDCSTGGYYTNSFLAPGYVFSEECSAGSSTDAAGITWNMGSTLRVISDGYGGSYSENFYNISPCGAYPSGYAYSYTSGPATLYYLQGNTGAYGSFDYGTSWSGTFSDGTYDGSYSSAATNVHYSAGYVFYTYWDGAGNRNVFYNFDGVSGYYETNDAP